MTTANIRETVKTRLREIICEEYFSFDEAKLAEFAGGDHNFESISLKGLNIDLQDLCNIIFGLEYSFDLASLEDSELDSIINKPDAKLGDLIDMLAKRLTPLESSHSNPQSSVDTDSIQAAGSVDKIASNRR